ncbi:hypothetical protein [Emcibacter sp. SYSU 3D8]|uniref:acyltransferase n=1 Tax=Emcibacter sp. SYSU 3D8 TaxID=3133969 RepID=UPI0031FEB37A
MTDKPRAQDFDRIRRQLRWRRLCAEIISRLPLNGLRCCLYRLLGYSIRNSAVGRGTVIAIEALDMSEAHIGVRNKIVGPFRLEMRHRSAIGSGNTIVSGFWAVRKDHAAFGYRRELVLEEYALLTIEHWVDVIDRIRIGAGTHIAGIRSEFWTHGHTSENRDIDIGKDCFVGSSCIFTPGSGLADRSVVGSGSVITKKHPNRFSMLSGNPAEIRRTNYYWRTRSIIEPDAPPPLPETIRRFDKNTQEV